MRRTPSGRTIDERPAPGHRVTIDSLLAAIVTATNKGSGISTTELAALGGASIATVKRQLQHLLRAQKIVRTGQARATRYFASPGEAAAATGGLDETGLPFALSPQSRSLRASICRPLAARLPVSYRREFIDGYAP
ncbi:MAG: hypothetical protein ABWY05_15625, partial [Noviherbaspirillum sp.]